MRPILISWNVFHTTNTWLCVLLGLNDFLFANRVSACLRVRARKYMHVHFVRRACVWQYLCYSQK